MDLSTRPSREAERYSIIEQLAQLQNRVTNLNVAIERPQHGEDIFHRAEQQIGQAMQTLESYPATRI
jgi:exonuclease VII small subunit